MAQKTVLIDIGHGSNTYPASGKGVRVNGVGYAEHNFNSALGIELRKLLEQSGVRVLFGQEPYKRDVPLRTRTNWYNRQRADLLVSLHANAGVANVQGRCAFYWHSSTAGRKLANLIIAEIRAKGYTTHGNGLHASQLGSWTNLHMVREPKVPSVLVEHGFMTNTTDFQLIFGSKKSKYISDMADADARAICKFLGVAYKGKGGSSSVPSYTPPTATVKPSSTEVYVVKSGDTLWQIAQANGLAVAQIKSMNGLTSDIINVGQKLTVKKSSDKKGEVILSTPANYTIKSGDTLSEIAFEMGMSLDSLIAMNGIKNPSLIVVGQTIKVRADAPAHQPIASSNPRFVVGEKVKISTSASRYATGQAIPNTVKGRTYTIMQTSSDKVLIQEIMSWVYKKDIVGGSGGTVSKPSTSGVVKAGSRVTLSSKASRYATGESIPSSVKGKTYTVLQVSSNKALLKEIMSWVKISDIGGSSTPSSPKPSRPKGYKVNQKVKIKGSASRYATGESIPTSVKGKVYTIMQMSKNGSQALLKEIMSWVKISDLQ